MGADHSGVMWMPTQPPTLARLMAIQLDWTSVIPALAVLALALYLLGVIRLRRSGVGWAWHRTMTFTLGVLSVLAVTATGVQGYGMVLFSIHMSQHMVLSMVSPILLLLGAPVTLALRTLPRGHERAGASRRWLLVALHSRFAAVVSHPGFTMPLFIASLYGIYFTPLVDLMMENAVGHIVMLGHFLVTGLLFFGGVLAVDPWPHSSRHPVRMLELLLPMPMHAFFCVAIMMASTPLVRVFSDPPAAWDIDPMADQSTAGSLTWVFGELPTILVLGVVFFSWVASDERRNRAADRAEARSGDLDLAAYNAHLAQLAQQSARSPGPDAVPSR